MFLPNEPSETFVEHFIASQKDLPFSYDEVGATREGAAPKGYASDRYRVKLGKGEEAYRRAVEALQSWRQFDLGWARLLPPGAKVETGTTVAVLAWHLGFWSLNSARVVYTIEENSGDVERFGFAYGTLPGHAQRGEERFSVGWDKIRGAVHYNVFAFSRPNHPLAWLGYPLARRLQRRFARDSKRRMVRAVGL